MTFPFHVTSSFQNNMLKSIWLLVMICKGPQASEDGTNIQETIEMVQEAIEGMEIPAEEPTPSPGSLWMIPLRLASSLSLETATRLQILWMKSVSFKMRAPKPFECIRILI